MICETVLTDWNQLQRTQSRDINFIHITETVISDGQRLQIVESMKREFGCVHIVIGIGGNGQRGDITVDDNWTVGENEVNKNAIARSEVLTSNTHWIQQSHVYSFIHKTLLILFIDIIWEDANAFSANSIDEREGRSD